MTSYRVKSLFTLASILSSQAAALHCLIGWPAIVGSSTKDGNTGVQVWAETPFSDNYLIGGNSDSADFTEDATCASNGKGCAYLANWNKVSQVYTQKWIFNKVSEVVDIKFESFADV